MKLYYAAGVYVGTQVDAKRLDKDFATVEVPTDKDGLMAFLNRAEIAALAVAPVEDDIADLLGEPTPEEWNQPGKINPPAPMTAGNIVSAIDLPGIENVVEAIAKARGQALRRLAGAVAVRFEELAK